MIQIVDNHPRYWPFIGHLRSDPRVQRGFIDQISSIDKERQAAHMLARGDRYVVAVTEAEGVVGYARSFDGDIGICVSPDHQGEGIGRMLVGEILRRYPDSFARIKADNPESLRLFRRCGFSQSGEISILQADGSSINAIIMQPAR